MKGTGLECRKIRKVKYWTLCQRDGKILNKKKSNKKKSIKKVTKPKIEKKTLVGKKKSVSKPTAPQQKTNTQTIRKSSRVPKKRSFYGRGRGTCVNNLRSEKKIRK